MTSAEIKELRKKLGLSQRAFAEVIGTSRTTVENWEIDKFKPSPLALEKLNKIKEGNKD